MKVHEILNEVSIFDENVLKKTAWKSFSELKKWLTSNGFTLLGDGFYANAYVKSGFNRIVKISRRQDKCWLKYISWTLKQTKNPYLPNIPWVKTYDDVASGQRFFVTVIEKLKPLDGGALEKIDDPVVLATIAVRTTAGSSYWHTILSRLRELGVTLSDTGSYREQLEKYLESHTNHKFYRTVSKIENLTLSGCHKDMHSENIMYRVSTNSLVITDPLS